jgi:hypothetical protein
MNPVTVGGHQVYSNVTVTLGRQSGMHGESKARILVHYKMNQMNRPNKASTVVRQRAFSYDLYTSEPEQLRFVIKITVCRQRILLQETRKVVFQPINKFLRLIRAAFLCFLALYKFNIHSCEFIQSNIFITEV